MTGTSGFKGSWLAFWLTTIGAKVVGISLKPEKNAILYKHFNLEKKIKQYFIDISNFELLNKVIKREKPDLIFHLAAQSIVSKSFIMPLKTFKSNIIGSANVLESFRINNIQNLVYITSDKCYSNLDIKKTFKETDELGGFDNYSSSKASAELIFSSYFYSYFKEEKFLKLASARAGNVVGGGDMKENRIIPDIIRSLTRNKNIYLRNPRATRPWQHVLEPLSGYLLLGHKLINKELKNNILPNWNFGPKKKNCKNVMNVTKQVLKNLSNNKIKIKISKSEKFHESKYLSLNINKAKKELKWQPKLNFDQTIEYTMDWYKSFLKHEDIQQFSYNQIQKFLNSDISSK